MMILIAFLLVLAIAALLLSRKRTCLTFLFSAMLSTFVVGTGLETGIVLRELQTEPPLSQPEWKNRNVIVLLGAGAVSWEQVKTISSNMFAYSRIHEAARLFFLCRKSGKLCRILVTGGDPAQLGMSEAEVVGRELEDLGILPANLTLEKKSNKLGMAYIAGKVIAC